MQINALMSAYATYAPRNLAATGGSARPDGSASAKATKPASQNIVDSVSFSAEALARLDEAVASQAAEPARESIATQQSTQALSPKSPTLKAAGESTNAAGDTELTTEEQEQVDALKSRDSEVRQHEQAHVAAAGGYVTGGPTYSYQRGPDGQRYAVGGEVQIDTSPVEGDPEATAQKARVVRAAALAPAEPSSQDLRVAASASKMEQDALAQLRQTNSLNGNSLPSHSAPYGTQPPEQARFLNVVA